MEVSIDDLIQALPLLEKVPVVALKKLLDERHKLDDLQENQITVIKEKYQALMLPLIARVEYI